MDKRKIFDKSIYCLYEMYNDNLDSLINMNNKSSNYNGQVYGVVWRFEAPICQTAIKFIKCNVL
jgi:hypothetical protein